MHHQRSNSAKKVRAGQQPGRWYLIGLSGLTVFLLVLFMFGPMAGECICTSGVHLRTRVNDRNLAGELTPAQIVRDISDRQHIHQALVRIGHLNPAKTSGAERDPRTAQLLERLRVTAALDNGGDWRVEVSFAHPNAPFAAAVARQMSEDFAERYQAKVAGVLLASLTQARDNAEQARRAVGQCESEVERLLEKVFPSGLAQRQLGVLEDPSRSGRHPLAVVLAAAEIEVTDPEVLLSRLATLEQERTTLLKTRTEQHPAVVQLGEEIALIKRQLDSNESHTKTSIQKPLADEEQLPAASAAVAMSEETKRIVAQHHEAAAIFHGHRRRLEEYVSTLQTAETEERQAWERHRDAMAAPLASCTPVGGVSVFNPSKWRMATLSGLGAALVLAAGIGWVSTLAWQTCLSPRQLQLESGVPLVAMVRSGKRLGWSPRWWVRQSVGGWRIFCELTLAGCIVWVVVMSLCDGGFAREFWGDPLGQIAGAAQRTAGLFGK